MAKASAGYVDGFVFVVPKKNVAAYRKMAVLGAKVWKKYGALEYFECMGDDLRANSGGGMTTLGFKTLTKAKPSDTVWFSYITYKSKAHRDAVNKKVMKDPMMNDPKYAEMQMPFDPRRMSTGGFKVVVK